MEQFRILALNPGATSTKFAVFDGLDPLMERTLRHSDDVLAPYRGRPMVEQFDFRRVLIECELEIAGFELERFDAVVGRGGLLKALPSGTYEVSNAMIDDLARAARGDHASNLGGPLAAAIAAHAHCPAYIVDPVSVDEWEDVARFSGTPLADRVCLSHALNTKATAKRFARDQHVPYEELQLVVAHIGSGNTVSAHRGGRMVDATNSREEGSFSAVRAGTVPALRLIDLCFTSGMTDKQLERALAIEGGLKAYLGTSDLVEVERRIDAGDARAALVFEAMAYQIAKDIGAMATVLGGDLDAVVLTGGMAHSARLVKNITARVQFLAPVAVYPGEDELRALAEGALRVLRCEETARTYEPERVLA